MRVAPRRVLDTATALLLVVSIYFLFVPVRPQPRDAAQMLAVASKGGLQGLLSHGVVWDSDHMPVALEVTDFTCEACRIQERALAQPPAADLRHQRLAFFLVPDRHPRSLWAARVAVCAGRFGQFGVASRALFGSDAWLYDSTAALELNRHIMREVDARVATCMKSSWPDSVLIFQQVLANGLHVSGTPSLLWVNGSRMGALNGPTLDSILGQLGPAEAAPLSIPKQ